MIIRSCLYGVTYTYDQQYAYLYAEKWYLERVYKEKYEATIYCNKGKRIEISSIKRSLLQDLIFHIAGLPMEKALSLMLC